MPSLTRRHRLNIAAGVILLAAAAIARGEDQSPTPAQNTLPTLSEQTIYKGVVGNLLEEVPIDPEERVQLQRGSAVLSNTFSGRSLAVLLGIASPPLMIGGLLWGLWSASQIGASPASSAPPKDNEALDRLVANDALRSSTASGESAERDDSVCSISVAAECERLADLFQHIPAKRLSSRPAEQARRDAAHAQLDAVIAALGGMPLLEVALEQPSIR